ncbi:MAG: hypothetical protein E7448_00845 [Ruminococcaceae bacterium]|nr:hypothetical protein [Oscillospiraceae bacterium]
MTVKSKRILALLILLIFSVSLCLSACVPRTADPQNSVPSDGTEAPQTDPTGSTPTESTNATEATQPQVTQPVVTQPPHTHSYTEAVTAPDCSNKGYSTYTCDCGDSYVDKEVPATGEHNVTDGICTSCGLPPIPAFTGGNQNDDLYSCGNDNYLLVYSSVYSTAAKNYEKELQSSGYTLTQSNEIGSNRFATFHKGEQMVHCVYFAADREYRITYGPKTYMGETQAVTDYSAVVTPSVSMIAMSCDEEAGTGMCIVAQLADGSYVIIDGGFGQKADEAQRSVDMKTLLNFLKDNNPNGGKPQVTWMITHADWDHIGLPVWFTKLYGDQIQVNTVCYNFPIGTSLAGNIDSFMTAIADKYPNANHYIMHTGNKLYLPGCEIEFLFTAAEDLYPTGFKNGNYTSNAWRMTIEGKTILITGDIENPLSAKIARNYGNYLASDILQVVHHGVNGATKELYQYVNYKNKLKVCFWTIPTTRKWRTEESAYRAYNQILWDSGAEHYYHDYTTTIELPSLTKR